MVEYNVSESRDSPTTYIIIYKLILRSVFDRALGVGNDIRASFGPIQADE